MQFNSYDYFLLFLPIVLALFYRLKNKDNKLIYLIFISISFYSINSLKFLSLFIISTILNYVISRLIKKSKWYLYIGITVNCAMLIYFKYRFYFNISNAQNLAYVLPLGVSFFTFQQITFLNDVALGYIKSYNLKRYFLYISFFPQLIAGPIVRYNNFFENIDNKKFKFEARNIKYGTLLFFIGLSKKVVLADCFRNYLLNSRYLITEPGILSSWIEVFSYSFQIYFDFSGYTDMALGTALLFNITLPLNFNSPYKSSSFKEFWQRWHITLSNFWKENLYIKLGGNRSSNLKRNRNLLLVFLVAGAWHGLTQGFIIWGFLHFLFLTIEKYFNMSHFSKYKKIRITLTFIIVSISWTFFRYNNLSDASIILKNLVNLTSIDNSIKILLDISSGIVDSFSFLLNNILEQPVGIELVILSILNFMSEIFKEDYILFWLLLCFLIIFMSKNSNEIIKREIKGKRYYIFLASLIFICIFYMELAVEKRFIYFEF